MVQKVATSSEDQKERPGKKGESAVLRRTGKWVRGRVYYASKGKGKKKKPLCSTKMTLGEEKRDRKFREGAVEEQSCRNKNRSQRGGRDSSSVGGHKGVTLREWWRKWGDGKKDGVSWWWWGPGDWGQKMLLKGRGRKWCTAWVKRCGGEPL